MGKGKRQGRVGQEQEAYANKEQGIQDTARAKSDALAAQYTSAKPGEMSPYAAADYGSDVENISRVYQNLRQNAYRALGGTGFGRAPSGREASMLNTLGRGQAEDLTGAYRAGLNRTEGERDKAMGYYTGEQAEYNPNAAYGGATNSYSAADAARAQSFKTGLAIAEGVAGFAVPGISKALGAGKGMSLPSSLPFNIPPSMSDNALTPQPGGGFSRLGGYAQTSPSRYGYTPGSY